MSCTVDMLRSCAFGPVERSDEAELDMLRNCAFGSSCISHVVVQLLRHPAQFRISSNTCRQLDMQRNCAIGPISSVCAYHALMMWYGNFLSDILRNCAFGQIHVDMR